VIAVDTNVLVYAHREDSEWHAPAYACLETLAEGKGAWAIPWPCVHEFFSIVTHPRIYDPPTPVSGALEQIDAWLETPGLVLLSESGGYWPELRGLLEAGQVAGGRVHDARVAALCQLHGVRELWTADRDFSRFSGLALRNPLIERV
jgi:toxin-antitoxin system PIN domain toxin